MISVGVFSFKNSLSSLYIISSKWICRCLIRLENYRQPEALTRIPCLLERLLRPGNQASPRKWSPCLYVLANQAPLNPLTATNLLCGFGLTAPLSGPLPLVYTVRGWARAEAVWQDLRQPGGLV